MDIVASIIKALFGSKADKDRKQIEPYLEKIKAVYPSIEKLTNDELRAHSEALKKQIADFIAADEARIVELKAILEKPETQLEEKEKISKEIDETTKRIDEKIEEVLDKILPEAFAIMKDTARRFAQNETVVVTANDFDRNLAATKDFVTIEGDKAVYATHWLAGGNDTKWDMIHYDVQLFGGVVLHQGKIAEMATGEGKTLVATLPVFLNALAKKGVHMVTVNNYLAKRDSEWMGPMYQFHGLSVACIDALGEGRGEQYPKYCSPANGFAKKSKVVGGLFHKRACVFDVFETSQLLPKDVSEDKPMIYYFFPIHNNQFSYGYLAVSYEDNYSTNKTFNNWLAILGNALEMIRIKQKNQGLLQELNNLYVHDALTGLYNRRGFDSVSLEKYKRAKKEKKSFVIFAIDMDNLKVVNDRFGHMNGDLALRTIGEAMQAVAGKEDACARVGGDEYNVVGIGYTEDMAEQFVKDFNGYLEDFNEESELPYLVKASVGYCLLESEKERDLEDCVNAADGKLYEYKRDKKKKKLDNVLREMEG